MPKILPGWKIAIRGLKGLRSRVAGGRLRGAGFQMSFVDGGEAVTYSAEYAREGGCEDPRLGGLRALGPCFGGLKRTKKVSCGFEWFAARFFFCGVY